MTSESASENRPSTALFAAVVAVIVLVATVVRVWYAKLPVNADEAYTYLTYARGTIFTALGKYNLPNNHVLNSLLIHASRAVFGDSYFSLRLPTFAFGIATVLAASLVWRALSGSVMIALSAACFTCVSARMIHASVEARGYGIEAFFFLCSLAAADRVLAQKVPGTFSTSRGVDIFIFALVSALGLLAVPTHLYAVAAIALWMLLRTVFEPSTEPNEGRTQLASTIRAHVRLIGITFVLYLPVLFYVALNGTKIEAAEPLSQLRGSLALRFTELLELWRIEHSALTLWWLAAGLLALVTLGLRSKTKHAFLVIALMVGPLLMFVATKRVAPFARVWTFLLPSLFALAAIGWLTVIELAPLERRARRGIFAVIVAIPLIASMTTGSRRLQENLASAVGGSAERAWDSLIVQLKSGDHVGFGTEFYQQVRFLALTKHDFEFKPLARRTEENVDVVEQDGRVAQKADPFDIAKPGRIYLYAFSEAELKPMENWLRPYMPVGAQLVTVSHEVGPGVSEQASRSIGFPVIYEFTMVKGAGPAQ
jgi:hypothetical protein